ncbi:hypothetical protein QYZ87_08050 [Porphyromonadaceae bacterium W3.11]|nr:hypothetical protein [Porphyromonadaceae bacterium W3.11]
MKVYVNDMVIEVFEGAKVIDALNIYASEMDIRLPHPIPKVEDQYGNEMALDGMLSDGVQLKL